MASGGEGDGGEGATANPGIGVFLSGVSSEFEHARSAVRSDLSAKGWEVKVQSDLVQGEDGTTLERLHTYIDGCSTVLCLIGKRAGAVPPLNAALPYLSEFADDLPDDFIPSYTQWELVFARAKDKRLLIFHAGDDYVPDEAQGMKGDDPELQAEFTRWIFDDLGLNRWNFSSSDELGLLVLREDWTTPAGTSDEAAPLGATGQTRLVHDGPAPIDRLGRENLAEELAARLVELVDDPESPSAFAVHVDGRWGEGKSTLVGFLASALRKEDPPWTIIEMDAWRSSQMSPAWWALLTHLRVGVQDSEQGRDRRRFRRRFFVREAWRLKRVWLPSLLVLLVSLVLLALGIDVVGVLGAIASLVALAVALGGFLTGFLGLGSVQGARLHERTNDNPMSEVISQFDWIRRQTSRPILLVLDDLDRCNERFAVEVLDAVQTLLRTPASDLDHRARDRDDRSMRDSQSGHSLRRRGPGPFKGHVQPAPLVIVGLGDQRWLRAAYEHAYSVFSPFVSEPGRPLGHLFLNKLFQLRIELPSLRPDQFGTYLGHLLGADPDPDSGDATVDDLRHQLDAAMAGGDDKVTEVVTGNDHLSAEERQKLVAQALKARRNDPHRDDREQHLLENYADLLDQNPRSAKRFVMAYNLSYAARLSELTDFSPDTLALWTVVAIRWPELVDWIRLRIADSTLEPREEERDDPNHACHLLDRPEVQRVLNDDRGGPLNEDTLPRYCGIIGPPRAASPSNRQNTEPHTATGGVQSPSTGS